MSKKPKTKLMKRVPQGECISLKEAGILARNLRDFLLEKGFKGIRPEFWHGSVTAYYQVIHSRFTVIPESDGWTCVINEGLPGRWNHFRDDVTNHKTPDAAIMSVFDLANKQLSAFKAQLESIAKDLP